MARRALPENELRFPLGGLVENSAYIDQPPGTAPDCLNVLPFDQDEDRARGGQRPGCSKYLDDRVNGANAVQDINALTTIVAPGTLTKGEILFVKAFNNVQDAPYPLGSDSEGHERFHEETVASGTRPTLFDAAASTYRIIRNNNQVEIDLSNTYNADGSVASTTDVDADSNIARGLVWRASQIPSLVAGSKYIARVFITTFVGDANDDAEYFAGIAVRAFPGDNEYFLAGWHRKAGSTDAEIGIWKESASGSTAVGTPTSISTADTEQHTLLIRVNDDIVTLHWDHVQQGDAIDLSAQGFDGANHDEIALGFYRYRTSGTWADNTTNVVAFDNFKLWDAVEPASSRIVQLFSVAGGAIMVGDKAEGLELPTGGTDALSSTVRRTDSLAAFGKVYFCDGTLYKVYNPATNAVTAWTLTDGNLPGDADDDGDADTAFTGASIMALYRGRVVLSGVVSDPQNWFMSRIGNPLDFAYAPTPSTAADPVAGNNSLLGKLGDVITCLIAWKDDLLIMGGQGSIWVMVGDPMSNGSIDLLTDMVGIAGPKAWCKDPDGNVYVFATNGVYRIYLNRENVSKLQPLSIGKLDKTFGAINFATDRIEMEWFVRERGMLITITPVEQAVSRHFWYDGRTDSFWPVQFPASFGPTCLFAFDGDDPNDRRVLMGGFDGYIRHLDRGVKNDDKQPIESHIIIPIKQTAAKHRITVNAMRAVMAESSDQVKYEMLAAETPEKLLDATARYSGQWIGGGQQTVETRRASGAALALRLSNKKYNKSWAMEAITLDGINAGRTKGTRKP